VVALLTRSLGQRKANKKLDTFTVPVWVQPAGRINQAQNWPKDGLLSITYRAATEQHRCLSWASRRWGRASNTAPAMCRAVLPGTASALRGP